MYVQSKLRGKMAEMGLTGIDLANRLGIAPCTFYRKFLGKSEFTRSEIQEISNFLGFSANELRDIFFAEELA